jgi:hypothetical protein
MLNLKPEIEVIEECDDNWQEREMYWISYYKNIYKLTNLTEGGDGVKGLPNKRKRKVTCYNLDGSVYSEYQSLKEAGEHLNINPGHISYACNGKINTYSGKIWRCDNDILGDVILNRKRKPIIQTDLEDNFIQEFESIDAASKFFQCKPTAISRVLRKERSKYKKFKFKYKDIV